MLLQNVYGLSTLGSRIQKSKSLFQLKINQLKITSSQHIFSRPRHSIRRNKFSITHVISTDTETENIPQPPHHTNQPGNLPLASPDRLISDSIIIFDCAIFLLQLAFPEISYLGVKSNEYIDQGQVWRLVSAAFLHGSPSHLILNMLSLHSLGPIVEWTSGRGRFLAIYMLSAVTGNMFSYVASPYPSLGASGAIFGLCGALIVFFTRNKRLFGSRFNSLILRLGLVIVLNFGIGIFLPQIDEWGHLGGLLGGALVAYGLGPKYDVCYIKGRDGIWLLDDPPIEALATPPRRVLYHDIDEERRKDTSV